jgi:hypothetical protein
MKKKIFIGMATLFFAAITFYNVQVTQQDGDISLENIALMAQASGESGTCCIGSTFIISPIPGGWRCDQGGSSCCPIC